MSMFVSKPNADDVLANLVPMRRYARALTRNETAAEDLVHEALVRAYEKRSTFRLGGNLRSWLLSILHNTFIDGQRRQKAEERRVSETAESADSWLPASQDNAIRLQQIKQAFPGLPPEQRSVLHLVAIEGMKYHEAAEALGISIGTLMSRLGRARAA
jgi:RNA polymerase sigma-70 factor, ECF subfamily